MTSYLFLFLVRAGDTDLASIGHFRIRITNARQVTDAGIHIQILKEAIIAVLQFDFRNLALGIANIPEHESLVRAGLRARRGKGIARSSTVSRGSARSHMSGDLCFLDPLHAKCAL